MDLDHYLQTVRDGITTATALADEQSQQVAMKLTGAVESSARLALISALSDAASEISADLAPGSVELRLAGGEPQFVVTPPPSSLEDSEMLSQPEADGTGEEPEVDPDEPVARISLRLPNSIKTKVDEQAAKEGISTNAWLMRTVMDALADHDETKNRPPFPGPWGPGNPWPFGPGDPRQLRDAARAAMRGEFGPAQQRAGRGGRGRPGPRGGTQGWAR